MSIITEMKASIILRLLQMLSLMNFASMEAPNGGVEYWHIIFVYVLILMVFFTPLLFSKVFRSKI